MLTPEYLQEIEDRIVEISSELERKVIAQIVKRLTARMIESEDLVFTGYDKWQMSVLEDSGTLYSDVVKIISKYTGYGTSEIVRAMQDAGIEAIRGDSEELYQAGIDAEKLFPGFGPIDVDNLTEASLFLLQRSSYCIRAFQRAFEVTNGEWLNFTRTEAFTSVQEFVQAMDRAYFKAISGAVSYSKALSEEIDRLAKQGIKIVTNPETMHRDYIDVASARCLRTGISQMSGDITINRSDELGLDLVLVSAHFGARPDHEKWQGKVYSRSGESDKYDDFVSSTGFGTGEGLCGWNCRHNFRPFIEGMRNPYEDNPIDTEESNKRYEAEQESRRIERTIRAMKREIEALKPVYNATKDTKIVERLKQLREKLKELNVQYIAHCEQYDLRPLMERLKA